MEKGAASPGRWQVWQCFCKIGATSLVNVGGGLFGSCPSAYPAQQSAPASRIDKYFMNFQPHDLDLARQEWDRTGKLAGRRSILPFVIAFNERNAAVDGEIGEALDESAGQTPSHLLTDRR